MKLNHGKIKLILILLMGCSLLFAEDFSYSFELNKKASYVKEPIILTVKMKQTNRNIVLLLNFDLKESEDYTFKRLDAKESDTYHNTNVRYTYIVYPLKSGNIDINFNLIKKIATDEGVAYSFSGDRDNVKGLITKDSMVTLPSLKLNVKALPKETLLVGDFNIDYKIKKFKAMPYEPITISITIKGEGFPPILDNIYKEESNITLFKEKPIVKTSISNGVTSSKVIYNMAISNDKSFHLPAVNIHSFNPVTQNSYILKIPKQNFEVTKSKKDRLVDNIDKPKLLKNDWSWLTSIFTYLLVFSAGFLSAFLIKEKKREFVNKNSSIKDKIEDTKSEKELFKLLLANDPIRYSKVIENWKMAYTKMVK